MHDARKVFKRCIEQVCTDIHVQQRHFAAAVGLNDFLLDTFDVPHTPKEVAASALDQLCEGDKRQNDQVLCLAVIAFLDEMLGTPKEDPDRYLRLRDLAELVASGSTFGEFERWVQTWYE